MKDKHIELDEDDKNKKDGFKKPRQKDLFSIFRERNYCDMITIGWVSRIMKYVQDKELKLKDFESTKEDLSSKAYMKDLKNKWKEVSSKEIKYPLLRCLFSLFKRNIIVTLLIEYFCSIMSTFNLLIMREILGYIDGEYSNRDRAVIFVIIMIFFELVSRVLGTNIYILKNNLSRGINLSIMGLIYTKIYKISGSNKKYSKGTINNIIQSDTSEVQEVVWMIPQVSSSVFGFLMNSYALYLIIGISSIIVILITIALTVFTYFISKYIRNWNNQIK